MKEMNFRKFLLIAFMISGMTALIYEIVWARPLQLIFGSTVYAVSTILTTFFAGFSLGSFLFRNIAEKTKNPVKLFALLELGIGLYGLIILSLFGIMNSVYLALKFPLLQFTVLFFIIIIPATLFGATWPVIAKAYIKNEKIGENSGKLYSFNSFGAFFGSLASGFILLPLLGITKTGIFAASLNLLISITIFAFLKIKKGEIKNES